MSIELSRGTALTAHDSREIFALWAKPETWSTWDPEVAAARLHGELALGARGRLKPRSGPKTTFTIVELVDNAVLVDVTSLPGARLTFDHRVSSGSASDQTSPTPAASELTVVISVEGPMSWLFGRLLRRTFAHAAQAGVDGLLAYLSATQPKAGADGRADRR